MEANTINKILISILCFFCVCIAISEIAYGRFYRFKWDVGVLAPKGEPIQIYKCDFDGDYYSVDKDKIMLEGYINYSDSYNENRFYPKHLLIQWFSYKENKFYEADFSLPKGIVSKAGKELRQEGYNDYQSRGCNIGMQEVEVCFVAELKPGGIVSVSMHGQDRDSKKEICTNKAHEIQIAWNEFHPETTVKRNEWVELVTNQYNWNLVIDVPPKHTVGEIDVRTFSTEHYVFKEEEEDRVKSVTPESMPKPKRIPYNIVIEWSDSTQFDYGTSVYFEEKQILACFCELYKDGRPGKSSIVFTVNKENTSFELTMKKEGREIRLPYMKEHAEINKRKIRREVVITPDSLKNEAVKVF